MLTRQRWRQVMLILAVGCVTLALSCGLGAVAVRQGAIAPPDISLELGSARVVGLTSNSPKCVQLIIPRCGYDRSASAARMYTLWLFEQSEQGSWSKPNVTQLLAVRLGR
jgi:hypothetical protein